MPEFQLKAIESSLAAHVRNTLTDPIYGYPLSVEPATGYGPCRSCLRTFDHGERRILFLYNPFSIEQSADFAGPIFIHANACEPYPGSDSLPEEIARLPLLLKAYDAEQRCVASVSPAPDEVEPALGRLFESEGTAYVHVRNAEAKCFIARVSRMS